MSLYDDYLSRKKNTAKDNEQYYKTYAQEWINKYFADTTLVKTIKEEIYPFNKEYLEYDVHMDSVSEVTVNTNKIIGNYLSLIFKDCDHKTYRGQKYLYNDEPYLCYDMTNDLSKVAKTQIIKCNNKIKWINTSGEIVEEPCFIGWEMTATNSNITKDVTIEQRRLICLIQGNSETNTIKTNQRFLLSRDSAFKVTQVFKHSLENINQAYSNLFQMYIEWDSVSEANDNLELNIADYYNSDYTLEINQPNISALPSSSGSLSATVELNGSVVNVPLTWVSSNTQVATIDESGNYTIVGTNGQTCTITCTMQNNEQVSNSITISVADVPIENKVLTIMPSEVDSIKMNTSKQIYAKVYLNGIEQSDVVSVALSGSPINCYSKVDITDGIEITCLKSSSTPLQVTFTSGSLTKTLTIRLTGIL
jgi:hypothetical protein